MRVLLIFPALAIATGAHAQTVVDGSENGIPAENMKSAIAEITKELSDPMSAQMRGVIYIHPSENRPDVVCGFINAKNKFGGYVGFKPFYYDVKINKGGIVTDAPSDLSYPLQFLPLEWTGCAKSLGIAPPKQTRASR